MTIGCANFLRHARLSEFGRVLCRLSSVLALVVALAFATGIRPIARFDREQINIQVHPDHIEVVGLYFYRNPWPFPVRQGLSIPFAVDEHHSPPVQVSVMQTAPEEKSVHCRYLFGRHRFDLTLATRAEVCVRVEYYQHTPAGDARYLLTTTQPWRKPLVHGVYRLFEHGVVVQKSNFSLQQLASHVLGFERSNFMPSDDWRFSWNSL